MDKKKSSWWFWFMGSYNPLTPGLPEERITEDGELRVTEEGQVRETETDN